MTIALRRLFATPRGTYGQLELMAKRWFTVERPATGEHARIPAGLYEVHLDTYYHGDRPDVPAYEIKVPGRSRILIHPANLPSELLGCIAPGTAIDVIRGEIGVLSSTHAFNDFMLAMNGREDDVLSVTDPLF